MAKDYVSYSKQRDASKGQDKWATIKPWKDPMGGANNPLMGNSRMKGAAYNKTTMAPKKGYGSDAGGYSGGDVTYGTLNKPSDSTA